MTEFSRIEVMSSMTKITEFVGKLSEPENAKKIYQLGVTGITIYNNVIGCGVQQGCGEYEIETKDFAIQFLPKSVITIVCETEKVDKLIEYLKLELYTGHIGDGKIFVSDIRNIIRVRTGEEGTEALKKSKID